MRRLVLVLSLLMALPTCGGGDGPKAKDWSGSPLTEQAVDYCIKLAACTADTDFTTIPACVDSMLDLSAFPGSVPTRRDLSQLVVLRECYNHAKSCDAVRRCVGIPSGGELDTCNLGAAANSCAQKMGVSTLRRCVPAPSGEGGVWLEVDCTKYGLVCGFNEDNVNLCVSDTCTPLEDPPTCEEATGDMQVCGGTDPVTGMPVGSILNEYACGALGLGCDMNPGDPADPNDDAPFCIGKGESCDPNAEGWACDGTTLSVCLLNLDGTGNRGSWDCAAGAIHHVCDAAGTRCAVSAAECDPTVHPGVCDGSDLTVCVDGTPYTTDCRLHGLGDCQADAEGHGRCVD